MTSATGGFGDYCGFCRFGKSKKTEPPETKREENFADLKTTESNASKKSAKKQKSGLKNKYSFISDIVSYKRKDIAIELVLSRACIHKGLKYGQKRLKFRKIWRGQNA